MPKLQVGSRGEECQGSVINDMSKSQLILWSKIFYGARRRSIWLSYEGDYIDETVRCVQ